jgi:purine catabolism regulator
VSIALREIVSLPHLGITVRAGDAGLDRRVIWAHVSELENPAAWLEGGELLLTTGIGLPASAEAQCMYLSRLAERGVAAVGVGRDGRAPQLTEEMLQQADELAFPILEIPYELPFVAITRLVAAANERSARSRLLAYLRIFETLRTATSEGLAPRELFTHLEKISGFDLYLCSPERNPLIEGVAPPPNDVATDVPPPKNSSPSIPGGYIVPVYLFGRVVGYLVALERQGSDAAGLVAVQHLATIAAVELSGVYQEREILRRRGGEVFAELLTHTLGQAETAARLVVAGFDEEKPVAILALRWSEDAAESIDGTLVDHQLWNARIPHLALAQQDVLYLLVNWEERVEDAMADLPAGIHVGVSDVVAFGESLADARREAQWSLERALELGRRISRFPDEQAASPWLSSDPYVLRATVDRVLGPVIAYDHGHNSALLDSLRMFLTHDGRLEEAARLLHIHKNTLNYRLRNVERLTGKKLGRLNDLVDLWLAVRAHDLTDGVADEGHGA